MTEQSPSAEALSVANRWVQPYLPTKTSNANAYSCAQAIDALIARRSVIMRLKTLGMRPLPSAPASTGEQPAPPAAVVDYGAMQAGDMLQALGDDAAKWAAAFCQHAKGLGHDIDEGWMIGWFANAIEHSSDVRRRQKEAAVVDYTERARALFDDARNRYREEPNSLRDRVIAVVAAALSAVASEHQAEIASLREQVNYFKTEYQDDIGLSGMREERDNAVELAKFALLARLREPDEAMIAAAQAAYIAEHAKVSTTDAKAWRAALTKIAEMLT